MYPSQTIVVKGIMDNQLLDDDLSTLSGSSIGTSFPRSSRHQSNGQYSNRNRKNKLHAYLNNGIRKQSKNPIISVKKKPSIIEIESCIIEDKDTGITEAPFDEVPIAIITKTDSNDDDDNDINSQDSERTPLCESWEVQEDGNLEPIMQVFPIHSARKNDAHSYSSPCECDHQRPRGQNKFEKSVKSAFISTASSTSSRSGCSSFMSDNASSSVVPYNSPARSTRSDGSVRQTRLERLRRKQNERVLASKSARTVLQRQQHSETKKKDQDRRERGSIDIGSNTSNAEKLSKSKSSDDDTKLTNSETDFERDILRLQQKLKDAKIALNYQKKILSEMSEQKGSEAIKNISLERPNKDHDHDSATSVSQDSIGNPAPKLNDAVVNTPQPTSPKSFLSCDTGTTVCLSSITSPARSTPYMNTGVNRARMKKRFHRNRRNYNHQERPLTKSPPDGRFKSIELDINEPPNVKRKANFSVLSADNEDNNKQEETVHELCAQSHRTESSTTALDNTSDIPHKHTVNLSISISGKSLPALDNFLNKIMKDLDKYQQEDNSILSVDTKCVPDSNFSQGQTKRGKNFLHFEESGFKKDTKDLNLLTTPTLSLIDDFRKAVDSLQASSQNNTDKNEEEAV